MIVHPFTMLNGMPDAGMLLGNSVPRYVLDKFNEQYSGGVQFGSSDDIFAKGYQIFNNAFVNVTNATRDMLHKAKMFITEPESFRYINCHDDLLTVPPCMYEPILTYDPIREFHANERIDGWGVDPDTIRDVDPYAQILNYGYMVTDPTTGAFPDNITWTWSTDDPDWSYQECAQIRTSREYIEQLLYTEMADGGGRRDPTGWVDGLLIGELR